ncbi:MAG: DEAD/DEAH box helicase, partial [Rhodothermales bacterium]|nr:DEAD/DEAH box helicase [Rhodothermales bacterium]
FEKVPPRDAVDRSTFEVEVGTEVDPEELTGRLVDHGFERVEFVEEPGEIAFRGGILDVYPFTGDYPVRIEFFGDEVDSIREFDIHTQRSVSRTNRTRIVPNLERSGAGADDAERTPIFSWLPESTLLFAGDAALFSDRASEYFESATEHRRAALEANRDASGEAAGLPDPSHYYMSDAALERSLLPFTAVHFGSFQPDAADQSVRVESRPQPSFNGRIAEIRRKVGENHSNGRQTIILCDNPGQEGRLLELLVEDVEGGRVELRVESIHEGFELPDQSLAVYTDHQIFGRYHRPTARKQKQRYGGMSLRELHHLSPGDFVVHIDYGIGRFSGMEQIEVRGRRQEAVKVLYRDEDVLYVNVNALYKLHKYKGKEGFQPALTKLGSGQWEKTKSRTKSRVKDIARDLIKLYARRKQSDGFAFSEDTVWQRELEASFQFEDTPDQAATTDAVKSDMGEATPMDRLVCGDVGFGKTEIAIRAAFKAVQDGKQVAVLVPTTVLAMQHWRTIRERLKNYPVRIDMLSRFRSSAQIRESLEGLKAGQVDIVVGTHRLVSKDVEFRDLGLLIVDEEQRFGVSVKEKLRKMRVDVDTLTLTATPIPRTLQFSLLGARDLSIIATAPPNRQAIETEIHTFDKDLIRDAILYETGRGGQVFFIHNRVQSIQEVASTVRMLVPDIRVRVAHGQMKGS